MSLHDDVCATLAAWEPPTRAQFELREGFYALLDARDDATFRTCTPGHVTASTLLLDHSRERALLTLHPRVGQWIQLGGHLEEQDESLVHAALREAEEESGITGLEIDPVPVHLSIHPIQCKNSPPTRHFDVRFVAYAPEGAVEVISDESLDLAWVPVGDVSARIEELVAFAVARSYPVRSGLYRDPVSAERATPRPWGSRHDTHP
ncbi:MAG: NUDIX domain-containing protein [Actinomycetia bacterium]|nr:NUDIX domain-containing protein [Actinomycetes bacterium]